MKELNVVGAVAQALLVGKKQNQCLMSAEIPNMFNIFYKI